MRPIKDVFIGGRERPVRFSLNALAEMCDLRDISLAQLEQLDEGSTKLGDVIALVYVGLKDGARKAGEGFVVPDGKPDERGRQPMRPASLYDVGEWIQEAPESTMEEVMEHFAASKAKADHVEDDARPDEDAEQETGAEAGKA